MITPEKSAQLETVADETLNPAVAPTPEVEVTAEVPESEQVTNPRRPDYSTKEEVVAALTAIAEKDGEEIQRDEVARLRMYMSNMRKAETDAEIAALPEGETYVDTPDPLEEQFKELLEVVKTKRAEALERHEAELQRNYEKKELIISTLSQMAEDTDNVNRVYQQFKELQQEFKNIGEVAPTESTNQWKRYQAAVEHFYDQLKVNKDLRDYDFKKNLEAKEILCSEAELLGGEEDILTAFHRLQELHDKWKLIGPVAKDIRDDLWNRFKDASAVINKKYQAHFEERKAREAANEEGKTSLCERVEAIDIDNIKSFSDWENATKQIIEAQEQWKKLGYASKKNNTKLYTRFREVCDKFFAAKAEFYKSMKDEQSSNLEKKLALCEKAEALVESTDWKKTSDQLTAMQKEWRTIGAVPRRMSDTVWRRFLAACDAFFERKKAALSGTRQAEQSNLKEKKAVIATLEAIEAETPREQVIEIVKQQQARWQEIGHVPFREKDKLYERYRGVLNEINSKWDLRGQRAGKERFAENVAEMAGDDQRLLRERDRLTRILESKRNELKTSENNRGFFNTKSKSGEAMLREIERRIQNTRSEIADLEEKIEVINSHLS